MCGDDMVLGVVRPLDETKVVTLRSGTPTDE